MLSDCIFFFLMIRRPPRSTLFPYTDALPISIGYGTSGSSTLLLSFVLFRELRSTTANESPVFRISTWSTSIRSEEHTSELQSHSDIVCRLLLEKKKIDTACPRVHRNQSHHRH